MSLEGPGPTGRLFSVEGFLRNSSVYLSEFRIKPRSKNERLSLQAWPGDKTGTSCLLVLRALPLSQLWGRKVQSHHWIPIQGSLEERAVKNVNKKICNFWFYFFIFIYLFILQKKRKKLLFSIVLSCLKAF